jgi:hypothetical protein
MKITTRPVDCYIGAFKAPLQETYLDEHGFSRGMILFAIPSYGVLFRCRADGALLDLEFGAFFALLRFIKTSLSKEKIKELRVLSSNPEFVFTMMNRGPALEDRPKREKMLKTYCTHFEIQTALIPANKNQAGLGPGDFCSTPKHLPAPVKPGKSSRSKSRFQPIQKGLSL